MAARRGQRGRGWWCRGGLYLETAGKGGYYRGYVIPSDLLTVIPVFAGMTVWGETGLTGGAGNFTGLGGMRYYGANQRVDVRGWRRLISVQA